MKPSPKLKSPDIRHEFYAQSLAVLSAAQIPFLVGGAYALGRYTGISRDTKDLDVFVRPSDARRALDLFDGLGYKTALPFPHWLGKILAEDGVVDVIFSSGNGLCPVDDAWFAHAREAEIFGVDVALMPPEEMIWSKAFIMERERFDGADVAHLLRAGAETLDWPRLLRRFGSHWRVLLSHLVLFGFIYPAEAGQLPPWVMEDLMSRLRLDTDRPAPAENLCQGTFLSREQYLMDVRRWGYLDARQAPRGPMSPADIKIWTEAIGR